MTSRFSASQRRYCAIFFPLLSADKWLRDHPSQDSLSPLVFTSKQRGAMRIVATNDVALSLGITPGMMLADARARVPDLQTTDHDPQADGALLGWLAEGCDRYTPSVALDPPDGLILDITGCAHIWDGEDGLVADLAGWLVHAGLTIRIALAETPDKARALARHGGESIRAGRGVPPDMLNEERSRWRPALPVAALDLTGEAEAALRRSGLYTIDDLACRPRAPLAARFGTDVTTRLARILGEEDVRITPLRPEPAISLTHRFAEPAARTVHLLATIELLAEDAAELLRERHAGGRAFGVTFFRSDGAIHRLQIGTGQPTRDPALLMRLFRERIDTLADPLDPGFGYDLIRFDVSATETLAPDQTSFAEGSDRSSHVQMLLDRLGVRLGHERVRRFAFGNSHIPECSSFTMPAHAPPLPLSASVVAPGEPPARPLHLFDPPQRVDVIAEVPDGPPRRFRWRRTLHEVVAHEGPERIATEWWKRKDGYRAGGGGLTRDYYRVEDSEGRRFWLFRHGLYGLEKPSPDWYLHGAFA